MAKQVILTKEILKLLPSLYANEKKKPEEIKVPLKCFNPVGSGSWFITELDPETLTAFGYVTGLAEDELGYVDMNELMAVKLRFGLKIERDAHWNPDTTLADVMSGKAR